MVKGIELIHSLIRFQYEFKIKTQTANQVSNAFVSRKRSDLSDNGSSYSHRNLGLIDLRQYDKPLQG